MLGPMGVHHDNLDHGGTLMTPAQAHRVSTRLSFQRPLNQPAPPAWKVVALVAVVIGAMLGLSFLSNWRADKRQAHIVKAIRDNVVTLASAAADYMAAHHVDSVDETQLIGPGDPIDRQPHSAAQESYVKLKFSASKPMVWVNIPDGDRLYFQINWSAHGTPNFVSDAMPAPHHG